jgi:histidinol dehydrogenase
VIAPIKITVWPKTSPQKRESLLQRPVFGDAELSTSVTGIIRQVRSGGDAALVDLTRALDRIEPTALEIGPEEMEAEARNVDPALLEAIRDASSRIEQFHQADRPGNNAIETAPGLRCEVRYQALSPVGLYIPGGSAPLVSTVMMLAIPARLAGCEEIVMCTPPGRNGRVSPEVLVAALLCGVTRVFCVGGAQAIAAMAYGTESIPACVKIFGPGNAWVTEAKQQVSMDPAGAAIDLPAGPSEVLVIADRQADPECVAWDLLSQAEHGPDSQVILLTDDRPLAEAVAELVASLATSSPRAEILEQSLGAARIILLPSLAEALALSNRYAPEHLIINTANAAELAESVRNAGSVFVGPWTPESLGDYCSGTNHVLPTYGWARSHGALGLGDFMRRMTFQTATREALARVGPVAEKLAEVEGLEAHRMAVSARLASAETDE